MTKPPATRAQMLGNALTNRSPVQCAVCDRYVTPFTGLPVILDGRSGIIEFAHPGCCVPQERTVPLSGSAPAKRTGRTAVPA